MDRIALLIKSNFDSSVPDFKSFVRKFKNDLKKELVSRNATLTKFNTGHFYVSGFFRSEDDKCFYFSISDVRYFKEPVLLYRGAKNETDYHGGINRYVDITTGMGKLLNLN